MFNSIVDAIKAISEIVWISPFFVLYVLIASFVSSKLKQRLYWPTGYTRKVFHFFIFTAAAFIQWIWGLPGVLLFGIWVSIWIVYTCIKGNPFIFYQAIARPKDAPHQTLFIMVPLISTAFGGLVSNLLVKEFAVFGYLIAGWGDAIAEPVGTRWGKHTYNVPSLVHVKAVRSLEGSAAVFLVGVLACSVAGIMLHLSFSDIMPVALLCGFTGALVEAISNHGLDNFTVQIAVSVLAWFMLK